MRRSIKIGAKKGIMDKTTEKELFGLFITNNISSIGTSRNIVTGITKL